MARGDEAVLCDVVSAVAARASFDVDEVSVRPAGGRRRVQVVVDRDGGVDLDAAAALSREIAAALDDRGDEAVGAAPYTLEVTSRGVSRPLTLPRHFRRAADRKVEIRRHDGTVVTGRIVFERDDEVVVLTGPDEQSIERLPVRDIAHATVAVEFSAPPAAVQALIAQLRAEPHPPTGPADERAGLLADRKDAP